MYGIKLKEQVTRIRNARETSNTNISYVMLGLILGILISDICKLIIYLYIWSTGEFFSRIFFSQAERIIHINAFSTSQHSNIS